MVVRDLANPALSMVYAEHTAQVKTAKFSPSGKFVASGGACAAAPRWHGPCSPPPRARPSPPAPPTPPPLSARADATGKVRVWAWNHAEHLLKKEVPALGGEVEDLAWDGESKRIVACGGGASKAKVFAWDTGSNLAEVIPHSKKMVACDLRPVLPHRLALGGEDFPSGVSFYTGAPFKYARGIKEHTNFVNCVRFSPCGAKLATVSADRSGRIYSGDSGEPIGRLDPAGAHTGGIYSLAWSPDGARLATAGGDKAVKVWDLSGAGPDFPCLATGVVGARPEDMQQSVAWPAGAGAGTIVSTSMDGTLNVFDAAAVGGGPLRRVQGHSAPALCLEVDPASGRVYTGCAGGRVCLWSAMDEARSAYAAATCGAPLPNPHAPTKKVVALALAGGGLAAAAWDDTVRLGDAATGAWSATVKLPGQPRGLTASPAAPELRFAVTAAAVLALTPAGIAHTLPAPYRPTCVDVSRDGALLAVGGEDKRLHLYAVGPGGALSELGETREANAAVSAVAISPDGRSVAVGDAGREVRLFDAGSREATVSGRWMAHTTRVTGLRWSPSGRHLASVASDRRLCVWEPGADSPRLAQDLAHAAPFAAVAWASDTELWTLGTDGVGVKRSLAL